MFSFHNSAKTFALHGKILVPYVWRDSQNFLLEINALRETFRKKLCHWQLFTIRKQLKDKVWKTPMPFFCGIEEKLLEENALLKPLGICPPLKSSIVFSMKKISGQGFCVLIEPKRSSKI